MGGVRGELGDSTVTGRSGASPAVGRVACLGGGPAGLFTAILLRNADPSIEVTVFERHAADETFGFGVVFSQETLDNVIAADPPSFEAIAARFRTWSAIDMDVKGFRERSDGHTFAALERRVLLGVLARRAEELGADLRFQADVADPLALAAEYDVLVAADGANSAIRGALAATFRPSVDRRTSKYVWFATSRPFEQFTFLFVDTPHGMFWAHVYPFDDTTSTFIVETDPETWRRAGLAEFAAARLRVGETDQASLRYCEQLFAAHLQGHQLQGNNSRWLEFPVVRNESWRAGNVVLAGDAAHTAHFSIGSGTKLALEDAIALSSAC